MKLGSYFFFPGNVCVFCGKYVFLNKIYKLVSVPLPNTIYLKSVKEEFLSS